MSSPAVANHLPSRLHAIAWTVPLCPGNSATTSPCWSRNCAKPSSPRSEEHTSELQSPCNLVCRLLLDKKRCSLRGLGTVPVDEVLALVGHAMLDRYASAEGTDALDVPIRDCLGVIEEPVHAIEGDVAV